MIVALHSVTDQQDPARKHSINHFIEISRDNLLKLILDLKKLNARFVSLPEVQQLVHEGFRGDQPLVHLSFDDGYEDNYRIAFPLLREYNIPFSIFVVSDFMGSPSAFLWWYMMDHILMQQLPVQFEKYQFSISETDYKRETKNELFKRFRDVLLENVDNDRAYFEDKLPSFCNETIYMPRIMNWAQLNEMIKSGLCDVGIHTRTHARFRSMDEETQVAEIRHCRQVIKEHTGVDTSYFAYSYGGREDIGDHTRLAATMTKAGISLALTTVTGELNENCDPFFLPPVFINNDTTLYSLKTRLSGAYQRSKQRD